MSPDTDGTNETSRLPPLATTNAFPLCDIVAATRSDGSSEPHRIFHPSFRMCPHTASAHGKTSSAGESVVKSGTLAVVSDTSSREEQTDERPAEVPAVKKARAGFLGFVIGAVAVVALAAYLLIRYRRRTIHRNGP